MANPNDVSFEIDAGKALAKLHLAGASVVSNRVQVLNSGIQDQKDFSKPDPENPQKTQFDLGNRTGEYQAAVVPIKNYFVSYQCRIDIDKLTAFKDALGKYNNVKGGNKVSTTSSTDTVTSNIDKNAISNAKAKNKNVDQSSINLTKEAKDLLSVMKSYKLKDYKENQNDMTASIKSFRDAVEKENAHRKEERKKSAKKAKSELYDIIVEYFQTFIGKPADNIKLQDVVMIGRTTGEAKTAAAAPKTEDISKLCSVDDYKISAKDNSDEIAALEEVVQSKDVNAYISFYPIFAVGFSVEMETM